MAIYFVSDIHLRIDRPERDRRFADWVGRLRPGEDQLVVAGDLCDFWFASRQLRGRERPCPGLAALASFTRQGGDLTILPGNHDAWLGRYYEDALGARFLDEGRLECVSGHQRILAMHGHQFGARTFWKHAMESRAFLAGFHGLPSGLATRLEHLLDHSNETHQNVRDQEYLALYRRKVDELAGRYDLVVLGHVHQALDDHEGRPRLVVLGDWKRRASFLRAVEDDITFVVSDEDRSCG